MEAGKFEALSLSMELEAAAVLLSFLKPKFKFSVSCVPSTEAFP
jgi:hypothetical protein